MSKRKLDEFIPPQIDVDNKKHSMDSSDEDEDEKEEKYNIMHENDLEGKHLFKNLKFCLISIST